MPVPTVEKPPRDFKTAEEHYEFLLERANGGTTHTMQTIPVWDGLWGSGNNTMPAIFLENGTLANAWRPGATKVKEGVLTPQYEQHFRGAAPRSTSTASSATTGSRTAVSPACRAGFRSRTSESW